MKFTDTDKWTVYPGRTPFRKQYLPAYTVLGLAVVFLICMFAGLFEQNSLTVRYDSVLRSIRFFSFWGILAVLLFSFGRDAFLRHEINTQTLLRIVLTGILGAALL